MDGGQAEQGDSRRASEPIIMRPGPGLDPETEFREQMSVQSPDGRPPCKRVRKESRILFVTALLVVTAVIVVALYVQGGVIPAVIALVLMLAFVGLAAWPAWDAAVERKIEEKHVEHEVRSHHHGHMGKPT